MLSPIYWTRSYYVPRGLTLRLGGPRPALVVARLHYLAPADDREAWVRVEDLYDRLAWLEHEVIGQILERFEVLGVVMTRQLEGELQARLDHQRLDALPPKKLGQRGA